jgi:hypothetical protein
LRFFRLAMSTHSSGACRMDRPKIILNQCRRFNRSEFIFARIDLCFGSIAWLRLATRRSSFPPHKKSKIWFESADNLNACFVWCSKGSRYTIWFQWQLRNGWLLDRPWIAQLPSSSAFPFSKGVPCVDWSTGVKVWNT